MAQVKIIAVGELQTATDGRKYFGVDFQAGFGQRKVSRNFWEQFKRDPKTGLPTQEKFWERGTRAEAIELMENRTPIEGEKVTKTVEKYIIGDREVTTWSTIVFPDENVVAVFASSNHNIVDEETGEVLGRKKAILAPASATPATTPAMA